MSREQCSSRNTDNQIKITGFTKLSRTFDNATETFDIHLFLFFLELESYCLHT